MLYGFNGKGFKRQNAAKGYSPKVEKILKISEKRDCGWEKLTGHEGFHQSNMFTLYRRNSSHRQRYQL